MAIRTNEKKPMDFNGHWLNFTELKWYSTDPVVIHTAYCFYICCIYIEQN